MKNDLQHKEKSVMTSLTGTSMHQMLSRRSSIFLIEKSKKNCSEKSFQRHLISGVRQIVNNSRGKINSRRYETLSAGQQFKKRQSKQSKSLSNNIYFPQKNFVKINQANEQKHNRNIISLSDKPEGGINKLQKSLNNIPKDKQYQKLNIAIHRSQTEIKQEVPFLTKLNLEKRNKIMEIYQPVVSKQFPKSRKSRVQANQKAESFKNQNYSSPGPMQNKTDSAQNQMFPIKQKQQSQINSIYFKTKSQHKLESSSFRPSLITHLIIDHPIKKAFKSLGSQDKQKISHLHKKITSQTGLTDLKKQPQARKNYPQTKSIVARSQNLSQKKQKDRRDEGIKPKFDLPKYTDFYDNYVSSCNLKAQNYFLVSHQSSPNEQITKQVQKLISNRCTPLITGLKMRSVTPRDIIQPCQDLQKIDLDVFNSTSQDSLSNFHFEKLKNQMLRSNRNTPKLKFLNQFFTEESNFNKENFLILKINQGIYFGQVDQKRQSHGIGVIFYKTAKLFEGYFSRGLKEGQGLEIYPDGSFFLGNYLKNRKNGKGRFEWSNGEIFDGQWLEDKKHGSGQWKADSSISYVGEWKSNRIEGFGVLIQGGQRYEGEFVNFAKQGQGTYRYENGQVYTGGFRNNRLNGFGEYFWPNADHYKGDFLNNKRHGKGNLYLASEEIQYRGEFRNDKKCGFGQETYRQKIQYVGNFENDLKHGWGILKKLGQNEESNDEIIYQGYWVNNCTIEMSETPVDEFAMIEQDEAEYNKNELSKSNIKKASIFLKNSKSIQRSELSPYKLKSQSRKPYAYLDMKPKQSIGLKGRSRYMRINNHYIQKSIQGSRGNLYEGSIEKLQWPPTGEKEKGLKRQLSEHSVSRHHRECLCGRHN